MARKKTLVDRFEEFGGFEDGCFRADEQTPPRIPV